MKKAIIFREYRDSRGIGSTKVFETKEEAIAFAEAEWKHLAESDKKSYKKDPAGIFAVGLAEMVYDEVDEEFYPGADLEEVYWEAY